MLHSMARLDEEKRSSKLTPVYPNKKCPASSLTICHGFTNGHVSAGMSKCAHGDAVRSVRDHMTLARPFQKATGLGLRVEGVGCRV